MMAPRKPCGQPVDDSPCAYPRAKGKTSCSWHWLLKRPIEQQVSAARQRAKTPHFAQHRARVPEAEWPPGERFCGGCQSFVPRWYARGSRCWACASQAAHASHVERTYELTAAEYASLLEFQNGRCWVCQQVPRVRRLAVDHDHRTGEVRGLLCANDEWGCNRLLARVLNDLDAARRLVDYIERYPLQRMRDGEPPIRPAPKRTIADSLREWRPFD